MILTKDILFQGKSINGGWSDKQMRLFNRDPKTKGWLRRLVGRDFPEEVINEFLSLKNIHLTKNNYKNIPIEDVKHAIEVMKTLDGIINKDIITSLIDHLRSKSIM